MKDKNNQEIINGYTKKDVDELVHYYLNHDVGDEDGEWMEVQVERNSSKSEEVYLRENLASYHIEKKNDLDEKNLKAVTIRISEADLMKLKQLGKRMGLGHTQVARMIIHDALVKRQSSGR